MKDIELHYKICLTSTKRRSDGPEEEKMSRAPKWSGSWLRREWLQLKTNNEGFFILSQTLLKDIELHYKICLTSTKGRLDGPQEETSGDSVTYIQIYICIHGLCKKKKMTLELASEWTGCPEERRKRQEAYEKVGTGSTKKKKKINSNK